MKSRLFRSISLCIVVVFAVHSFAQAQTKYAVLISANSEWKSVKKLNPGEDIKTSPWGEYFYKKISGQTILFFQEGWGKVAAAGATQYVIDKFNPQLLINLGTCGGFEGEVDGLEIILANKTIVYDIVEAMGDSKEAIDAYTTTIDLTWLGDKFPVKVRKALLLSADKDLKIEEVEKLKNEYHAIAGDWESGAIAYTARKNNKKVLILRGVSDLVSSHHGEAYGNSSLFEQRTEEVMGKLLEELPLWIEYVEKLIH